MKTLKDQFAPYAIAARLKALGFNEPCFGYFHMRHGSILHAEGPTLVTTFNTTNSGLASVLHNQWITLPLWQQVTDWLRDEHGINAEPQMEAWHERAAFRVYGKNIQSEVVFGDSFHTTRTAAIEHALKIIEDERT